LITFDHIFYLDVYSRALHTELELEYLSRDSSRNEFLRVKTRQVERHFFVIFGNLGKRLVPTHSDPNFRDFRNFFAKIRVSASRNEFGRLEIFLKYFKIRKMAISETGENENFGKKRLTYGLSLQNLLEAEIYNL